MSRFINRGVARQLAVAFTAGGSCFIIGALMGWPAPTLKKLRAADTPIRLSVLEESWVVNALYLTTMVSPFMCGALMNSFGRKLTLLALTVFPTLSWILVFFSRSGAMLIAARFLAGFWVGGCSTVVPIYVAEIAEPAVRGVVGTFTAVSTMLGIISAYVIGPCVSVYTMAAIYVVTPVLFFALFSLCPESPYFFVMRDQHVAAAAALTWLRARDSVTAELAAIQGSVERDAQTRQGCLRKLFSLVSVSANRKAFVTVEFMMVLQRMSGFSCLMAYSSVILPSKVGPFTSDNCTLIMGIVWLGSALICSVLVDRVGRKPLLYFSSIGIFVSMLPTSLWYYLDRETSTDVSGANWVPLAGVLIFGLTFTMGLGAIPSIYQGEMFSSSLKGIGSALTVGVCAGSSALSVSVFAVLVKFVGLYAPFLLFAAVGPATFLFVYYFVMETRGKSLQAIQDELRGEELDR
nr:PREDICTED: facilitated trehalose transporter Tret1-like [Bemisia tabaci]